MLQILDKDLVVLSGPIQSFHNGFTGGAEEVLVYIKNNYANYYYKDIKLKVVMPDLNGDIFSSSGWSIKIAQRSEQPTEKEWGEIFVNNEISISDIGNSTVANTETIHPVWIRVFCPGHTSSAIKADMSLNLKYSRRLVGDED